MYMIHIYMGYILAARGKAHLYKNLMQYTGILLDCMFFLQSKQCPENITIPLDLKKYRIQKTLYSSSKTRVRLLCTRQDESSQIVLKRYSKKVLRKTDDGVAAAMREATLHAQLTHEHIIKLYGAWETEDGFYMALEPATQGDLFDMIYGHEDNNHHAPRLTKHWVVSKLIAPLVDAVRYLHCLDVAHTDIKPENIAFTATGRLVLIDMGLAVYTYHPHEYAHAYTKDYGAPELEGAGIESTDINHKALDIWCIGALLFEAINQESPRPLKKSRRHRCRLHTKSKLLKQLFKMCCRLDPKDRPSIDRLHEMISNKANALIS